MDILKTDIARRTVLRGAASLGTLSLLPQNLMAQEKSLVIANWGGKDTGSMENSFATPYKQSTGINVVIDTSGPSAGKIRAMVQSGNVTWDVCDGTAAACLELGPQGLLEEIDYSIVQKSDTIPDFAYKWGVGSYAYSSVIVYDTSAFDGKKPNSWADFWNLKEFPGRRLLRADLPAMLEAALMADGVEPDKLYPLDVERGFEKIREIKSECLFWKSAAEAIQLLRSGEVVMGNMWHTTATPAILESQGRLALTWNQGILQPAVWIVPKGNPAGKEAVMKLISFMLQPEPQITQARLMFSGPSNSKAVDQMPEELRSLVPTTPENLAQQVRINADWYAENYKALAPRYLDLIGS